MVCLRWPVIPRLITPWRVEVTQAHRESFPSFETFAIRIQSWCLCVECGWLSIEVNVAGCGNMILFWQGGYGRGEFSFVPFLQTFDENLDQCAFTSPYTQVRVGPRRTNVL